MKLLPGGCGFCGLPLRTGGREDAPERGSEPLFTGLGRGEAACEPVPEPIRESVHEPVSME